MQLFLLNVEEWQLSKLAYSDFYTLNSGIFSPELSGSLIQKL